MEIPDAPTAASVSLKVLFAAEAQKATILRRGPRSHYHLILWDTSTDVFERGQWLRGLVRPSDLSPDGTRLLYWAAQYHRGRSKQNAGDESQPAASKAAPRRAHRKVPRYVRQQAALIPPPRARPIQTWTAISKPPYFTALTVWPSMGTWTGGGYFGGDGAIHVAGFGFDPVVANAGPPDVPVREVPARSKFKRSARLGDVERDQHQADVALALYAAGARFIHWVDLDARSGVTFAYDGRVYRSRATAASTPEDIASRSDLIADFTGLTFEQIPPPPSALQW